MTGFDGLTLAVLTYRRPDDLAELLPALAAQAAASPHDVDVLVVDNDPSASARAFVEAAGTGIRYSHEPTPGIAAARNRALDDSAHRDVLVYIDDDERPVDDWLEQLLRVFEDRAPAGVVGPVVSRYAAEPDAWLTAGHFFDRRRLATGTVVDVAATNNLLLDLRVVRRLGLRFDDAFGLSGGSDTLFTRQLVQQGGVLVWCDEAVVYDVVPVGRLTREWVLQRAYRSGNSWSRVAVRLSEPGATRWMLRARLSARGAVRVLGGGGLTLIGRITGSESRDARGLRTLRRGQGMLAGTWGRVYSEYRRS